MKLTRLPLFIFYLLFVGPSCFAQIEVSTGIDVSYPLLINTFNTKWNYGQLSFGIRGGVAYKPPETQFFPILNVSFGRTQLPLQEFGKNVVALKFDYLNVMLNENYIARFHSGELFIYGGIGFSYLMKKGITITGSGGEAMKASIDSTANVNHAFPAMNIGFEYNYGESAGKDLYITMGLNFQYILLLSERNTYYINIHKPGGLNDKYSPSLTGNVISPGFYLAIHYLLRFHKKGGLYL